MRTSALIALLVSLSMATTPQIAVAQSIEELLRQGAAAFSAKNYAEAEKIFRQAIQVDPKSVLAYNNLGIVLKEQGKLEEAIAAYRQAIQVDPKSALAYNSLGFGLYKQGKVEEAIAAYRQAIQLNPNFVEAQNNLKEAEDFLAKQRNSR